VLGRLWKTLEAARAAWEWWGILAWLGLLPGVLVVQGFFEGQPWSVIGLYVVTAVAFWIVIAAEGEEAYISLFGKRKRRRVARLMALRAEGVQILNRNVQGDGAAMRFAGDVDVWDQAVQRALREAGALESEIGWFTTLGTFTAQFTVQLASHYLFAGEEMHLKYKNILAEKLDRLLKIAQRLEGQKG